MVHQCFGMKFMSMALGAQYPKKIFAYEISNVEHVFVCCFWLWYSFSLIFFYYSQDNNRCTNRTVRHFYVWCLMNIEIINYELYVSWGPYSGVTDYFVYNFWCGGILPYLIVYFILILNYNQKLSAGRLAFCHRICWSDALSMHRSLFLANYYLMSLLSILPLWFPPFV